MEKIKLNIIGISYSQSQTGAYALILGEDKGKRRLPIIIGGFEAQSIAIALEKMKPSRPLTHDLFKSFAAVFGVEVIEVVIDKFSEGIFYSKLICYNGAEEFEIDSRTSDAIAIAVRFDCPIYTYEKILAAAGIILDADNSESKTDTEEEKSTEFNATDNEFEGMTLEELDKLLMEALDEEAYEKASKIRDEINRRKK